MAQLAGYNSNIAQVTMNGGSVIAGTAKLPVMIAPFGGMTIKNAYVAPAAVINAGTVNYATLTLINGGTAGTATTAIGTAGGTPGVTVAPAAFSLNTAADELTSGQYLLAQYAMTGALADNQFAVIIEWVHGKG